MTIDFRIFIPFVAPFIGILLSRALVWFAGFEWSDSGEIAFLVIIVSLLSMIVGCGVTALMFEQNISLGKIKIEKKRNE